MMLLFLFVIIVAGSGNQDLQFTHNDVGGLISMSNHLDLFAKPSLNEEQISVSGFPTDHIHNERFARSYVAHMSLDEELGQLLMVQYTTVPDVEIMISQQHIGGVIMYLRNISTAEQTKYDTAQMQQEANLPLFISIDQEGGEVNRLSNIYGADSLSAE
jgi:hypothetical protein